MDTLESDNILNSIDRNKVQILLNISGARNADEACRIAYFGRVSGFNWIKLEIHPDPPYLLPDPIETLITAEKLVKDGFVVLPCINADPALAKQLEEAGAHTVMPLGSPIGSNQGLQTAAMLRIIIEQAGVCVIVDAGIGMPSHAAAAIEMELDAVLVNTAIATRSGLYLAASTIGRYLKSEEPIKPDDLEVSEKEPESKSIPSEYPDHVWSLDLTAVPTLGGFWTSLIPNSLSHVW